MPINEEVWHQPARKSDITGLAIRVSIALDHVGDALRGIQKGESIDSHLERLKELSAECDEIFDRLSGWTRDGG